MRTSPSPVSTVAQFEDVYQHYYPLLVHILYHSLHSWEEAEDLAQESFLKAWQSWHDKQGNFYGWVHTIAMHKRIDLVRNQKYGARATHFPLNSLLQAEKVSQSPSPLEICMIREDARQLFHHASSLQRQVLSLRVQGYSHEEIAQHLGVRLWTSKMALYRLRRRYQKQEVA